jgi:hypothetical protein
MNIIHDHARAGFIHHNNDATERRVLYSELDVSSRRLKLLVNNCTGTSSMLWRNVRASLDGTRDAKDQLDDDIQPHSQRNDIHRWACRRYSTHVYWRQLAQWRFTTRQGGSSTRHASDATSSEGRGGHEINFSCIRLSLASDLATWRPGDPARPWPRRVPRGHEARLGRFCRNS